MHYKFISTAISFGIKDKDTFSAACSHANGAIIGSAYINALDEEKNIELATKNFLSKVI